MNLRYRLRLLSNPKFRRVWPEEVPITDLITSGGRRLPPTGQKEKQLRQKKVSSSSLDSICELQCVGSVLPLLPEYIPVDSLPVHHFFPPRVPRIKSQLGKNGNDVGLQTST